MTAGKTILVSMALVALVVVCVFVSTADRPGARTAHELHSTPVNQTSAQEQREVRETGGADLGHLVARLNSTARVPWSIADRDAYGPEQIPAIDPELEDAVLVALDSSLWKMEAGDEITLPVPQTGAAFSTVIDSVERGMGGARSFFGRLTPDDLRHSFVITVGKRRAYAHLGTPDGIFELAGNRSLAWLTPKASFDRLMDYTQPDYFLPDEDGIRPVPRRGR